MEDDYPRYIDTGSNYMGPPGSLGSPGTPGYTGYGGLGGIAEAAGVGDLPKSASDTYAAILQEQWETYVNTFVPIENKLIDYATDPNQVPLAMQSAHQNVEGAFSQQQGALGRRLAGLGVTLTPEQKASSDRQMGLSKALADVQGQNVARDLTLQRQQSILGNPAPTAASIANQATSLGS